MFFFKQKTAYEMRISDWSSDVCSSDLAEANEEEKRRVEEKRRAEENAERNPVEVPAEPEVAPAEVRSEERRVGKSVSVRVDLGGRRIIKKKNTKRKKRTADVKTQTINQTLNYIQNQNTQTTNQL